MTRLDLHSRYVLDWQLSNTLEADWRVETLPQSLHQWGKPQIFNTDPGGVPQGSQFTSDDFVAVLQAHQIAISWDGKGRALDNIFTVRRCGRTLLAGPPVRNVEIRAVRRCGIFTCEIIKPVVSYGPV